MGAGTETGRVSTTAPRRGAGKRPAGRAPAEASPGEVSAVVETTAEIPAVPRPNGSSGTTGEQVRAGWAEGTLHERSSSVVLPDGTVWHPGGSHRLPAPFALRLFVWLLFFLLLLGAAGLAVEHVHPSWLKVLRNDHSAPVVAPNSGGQATRTGSGGTTGGTGTTTAGFHLISNSSSGATYATGLTSYALVIHFSRPVWTVVASPAGSKNFLVEQTLQPGASPKQVLVNGSASVQLSAATSEIAVVAKGKTIGTVADPAVGDTYVFRPAPRA